MPDRILIVDAEVGAVEVVRQYLLEEGIDCDAVYDPMEALERLEWDRFSLLIMDLELPGIPGLELLRRASALDPDQKLADTEGRATPGVPVTDTTGLVGTG